MRGEPAGLVPDGAFARGNAESARRAFELLARARSAATRSGSPRDGVTRRRRDPARHDRRADRGLRARSAAASLSSAAAAARARSCRRPRRRCSLPYRIARDAEVIAPIGVALALVRDVVERTILSPSPEELARIRREAADRVVAAGAAPDRVEVEVEIDPQRNRVRATASGATALVESAAGAAYGPDERRATAAQSLRCDAIATRDGRAHARAHRVRTVARARCPPAARALDPRRARARRWRRDTTRSDRPAMRRDDGRASSADRVRDGVEGATHFGDVGRALPALYLLRGVRGSRRSKGYRAPIKPLRLRRRDCRAARPASPSRARRGARSVGRT